MKHEINQIGILTLVLIVGLAGVYQTIVGGMSGAEVYDYKTCCCTIVPLQDSIPVYELATHRQIQASGKDCQKICDDFYGREGWVYSKEGYCPR